MRERALRGNSLDTLFSLDDHGQAIGKRDHGRRGVAAEPRARAIRGGVSRQRRRCRCPARPQRRRSRKARRSARASKAASESHREPGGAAAPRLADRQAGPAPRGIRRAPSPDRDVLRSRRLDQHLREARRRGLARSGRRLSRRGLGGGDADGRACRQEAGRRHNGAVRLSARAGERRRTRVARRARNSARAHRDQRQKCELRAAEARGADRRRDRRGGGRFGGRGVRRRAQCRRARAGGG